MPGGAPGFEAARALHVEARTRFLARVEAIRSENHDAIMAVPDGALPQGFLELRVLRSAFS